MAPPGLLVEPWEHLIKKSADFFHINKRYNLSKLIVCALSCALIPNSATIKQYS